MVTESPMTAMPDIGIIGDGFNGEDFEKELGLLLREQRRQEAIVSERELNLYRSGSAPPTVEGSMAAIGGIYRGDLIAGVMEDKFRSDPEYLSYYYSNANVNPRLPPPVLSKEDWRSSQRIKPGGIESRRRSGGFEEQASSSLFSMQPDEGRNSGEWFDTGGDGVAGMPGFEIGRKKSYAELFQDDLGRTTPVSSYPSRPSSRNALFGNGIEPLGSSEVHLSLNHEIGSLDSLQPGVNIQSITGLQSNGKSTTQLVARTPSPGLPPVGVRIGDNDKRSNNGSCSFNRVSSGIIDSNDLVATLSGMSLSSNGGLDKDITQHQQHQKFLFDSQIAPNQVKQHPFLKNTDPGHLNPPSYPDLTRKTGGLLGLNNSVMGPNSHIGSTHESSNSFLKETTLSNGAFTNYGPSGYSPNPALSSMMANQIGTGTFPPLFENAAAASVIGSPGLDSRALNAFPSGSNFTGASDLHNLNMFGDHGTSAALQMPVLDPHYIQYMRTAEYEAQLAGQYSDPPMERGYMGNSYVDLLGIQKVYLEALLQQQKAYGMPYIGKSGGFGNGYYANPAFGFGMPYPGSPLASPVLPASPVGPGTPIRHGERNLNFPSGLRNFTGGAMRSWHSDSTGHLDGIFPPSLLEEFKNNKTRCYELSEIAGHIVEFSADQYGSRFIQQKLETATSEEKNMVFEEIMSQAFSLMTDVFGNYVIQKFFEHGSSGQRRELAEQLSGQVLTLSLQMYGCRVIQKAIEVVGLDQQTKMVAELDGHVMRCVRDQNGNHVIQKCIECVPQDAIQFIISSFYDQVVTLSTHPYGCRVIQRVLEHCDDLKTQQIMMDEIMGSVNMLAQDQYGNYVVQHILEHGKPHERSTVIKKLAGQIVQMSQQKFASNVVEKCLIFGGLVERQIIVNEMLGTTDENEPLQAMMKDQFANYVVQKVLETCDDQQRELILSRIKVHLNALKKYTYGKHIVARVEKLVAAGERRSGIQSSYTS